MRQIDDQLLPAPDLLHPLFKQEARGTHQHRHGNDQSIAVSLNHLPATLPASSDLFLAESEAIRPSMPEAPRLLNTRPG